MLDRIQLLAVQLAQSQPGGQSGGGTGNSSGQGQINVPPGVVNPSSADLADVVMRVINWGLGIAGGVAVLMLIVGGFLYLTAAGNSERIDKAKKTIKGAIIGIIIILISGVIVFSIASILQGPQSP